MASRCLILIASLAGLLPASVDASTAPSGRAAALSSLVVDEEVAGDVVAVAGNVRLGPNARVHGHAVAILGTVEVDPGAVVDGRAIAISSLGSLNVVPTGDGQGPYLEIAVRLMTAGGWLVATTLMAFLLPGRLRHGVAVLPALGLKVLALGVMVVLTLFAALVAALGLGPALGVPLAAALGVIFLVGRAIGLAVLGGAVGSWLLGRMVRRPLPLTVLVFVGVLLFLVVRVMPVIGGALWSLLSVAAVGAGVFAMVLAPSPGTIELPVPPTGSPRA